MVRSFLVFSVLAKNHTHLSIRACVARIPAKNFKEIIGRIHKRIVELEVTQTYKVALLIVLDLMRTLRTVHDLRKFLVVAGILARGIAENRLSVRLIEVHRDLIRLERLIKFHSLHERLVRSYGKYIFIDLLAVSYKLYLHSVLSLCRIDSKKVLALALRLEVHGSQGVSGLDALYVTYTVVILGEFLHLIWLVPVVVRLVVRICTHHQLDIVA